MAFESMAEVNGTSGRLHLWKKTKEKKENEKDAITLSNNRHNFKNISFHSNLTNKDYYSRTKKDGLLGIFEKATKGDFE